MDFADEHYVKLYTRDTATRLMWPWEAVALHPNLLRKADKAGIIDVGTREPLRALSLLVGLPMQVVEPGLQALIDDGTCELQDGRLVIPKFVDAQEARKTRAAVARDHREKKRDLARANRSKPKERTVTARDQVEPRVTAGDPPARPRPLPDPDPVPVPDPDPVPGREMSEQETCLMILERQRVEHCVQVGITAGRSKQWHPAQINKRLNDAVEGRVDRMLDGEPFTRWDELSQTFALYLGDDFGRVDKDGKERQPPWPIELFLSPGVLARFRRQLDGEAVLQ